MTNSPIPIGEVFADKYRVDGVLGEGGMGLVMYAQHLELDQRVAVKFLLNDPFASEEGAERFRREARAAAKIQSDHVVRVLDVGVLDSGIRYMVMEYLDGRDLAEELAEKKIFPIGVAAGFLVEAIDAVAHAHAVGIIHRDLKPANLFLTRRRDGGKRIKVLDFGISKAVGLATTPELSLTKTSAWIGSPLYMAPEQMESARDVDERADIWSLGAILYELVSGRTPYQADSLPHLCNLLLTQNPQPIKEICPEVPDAMADAIMGCLVRDPKARTQKVLDLARALAPFATSITGSSMRPSILMHLDAASQTVHTETFGSNGISSRIPLTDSDATKQPPPDLTIRSREDDSEGGTHAAWGATGPEPSKERSPTKIALLLVALVGLLIGGVFVAMEWRAVAERRQLLAAGEENQEVVASPTVVELAVPTEAVAPPEAADEEIAPEQTKPDDSTAPLPEENTPTAPSPRPAPKSYKNLVKRPKADVSPSPAVAPKGDFADFGGRR